jgi:hypothetical protein
MITPVVLIPAYGRSYEAEETMRADWDAGQDFRVVGAAGFTYCSIRDIKELSYLASSVRIIDPSTRITVRVA